MTTQNLLSVAAAMAWVTVTLIAVAALIHGLGRRRQAQSRVEAYLLKHDGRHPAPDLAAALEMSERELLRLAARSKVIVSGVAGDGPSGGRTVTLSFDPAQRQGWLNRG